MSTTWVVRASKNGVLFNEFARGYVGIGWAPLSDLSTYASQAELLSALKEHYPDEKEQKNINAASMLWRFAHEIHAGDIVLTYNPKQRYYLVGRDKGVYQHGFGIIEKYPNTREVEWIGELNRDALSQTSQNALSAMMSLFSVDEDVLKEVMILMVPIEETTQQFGLF